MRKTVRPKSVEGISQMSKKNLSQYENYKSTNSKLYKKSKKNLPTKSNFTVVFARKFRGLKSYSK